MISKNWSRRSAIVCAISILAGGGGGAQRPQSRPPRSPWWTRRRRSVAEPDRRIGLADRHRAGRPDANIDKRVQALALKVEEAVKAGTADPAAFTWPDAAIRHPLVFYAIARIPDRWAAGVALGGSPKGAIDTNRVFAVNFTDTPVLWASNGERCRLRQPS
jgi:hypothetical protein